MDKRKIVNLNFEFYLKYKLWLNEEGEGAIRINTNATNQSLELGYLLLINSFIFRNLANLRDCNDSELAKSIVDALNNLVSMSSEYRVNENESNFKTGFEGVLKSHAKGYSTFTLNDFGFGLFKFFNNDVPMLAFNSIFLLIKYVMMNSDNNMDLVRKIGLSGQIAAKLFGEINSVNQSSSAFTVATNLFFEEGNISKNFGLL